MCSPSAETSPLAFGEWEVDRGFELEEREGLEELEATEKASRAGFASVLKRAGESRGYGGKKSHLPEVCSIRGGTSYSSTAFCKVTLPIPETTRNLGSLASITFSFWRRLKTFYLFKTTGKGRRCLDWIAGSDDKAEVTSCRKR